MPDVGIPTTRGIGLLERPDTQNIKMIQLALEVRDDRNGGPEEE